MQIRKIIKASNKILTNSHLFILLFSTLSSSNFSMILSLDLICSINNSLTSLSFIGNTPILLPPCIVLFCTSILIKNRFQELTQTSISSFELFSKSVFSQNLFLFLNSILSNLLVKFFY